MDSVLLKSNRRSPFDYAQGRLSAAAAAAAFAQDDKSLVRMDWGLQNNWVVLGRLDLDRRFGEWWEAGESLRCNKLDGPSPRRGCVQRRRNIIGNSQSLFVAFLTIRFRGAVPLRAKPELEYRFESNAGSALPVGRVDLSAKARRHGDSGFA